MVLSEGTTEIIPSDTTGNRSRDRPTSSAAPDVTVPMHKHDSHLWSDFAMYVFVFLTSGSQRKRIFKLSVISLSSHSFSAKIVEFILSWGKISSKVSAYRILCPVLYLVTTIFNSQKSLNLWSPEFRFSVGKTWYFQYLDTRSRLDASCFRVL